MPQIHSLFPAGVLITNGLGADANSGALITAAKWSLFGCCAIVLIPVTSSGGGSMPFAPGEIQNFYKPVTQNDGNNDYIPSHFEPKLKNTIVVKFKYNDIENEKEFILNKKPFKLLIKLLNIVNITDNMIKIKVENIKTKIHNISIYIKKLKVTKD